MTTDASIKKEALQTVAGQYDIPLHFTNTEVSIDFHAAVVTGGGELVKGWEALWFNPQFTLYCPWRRNEAYIALLTPFV